MIVRLISTNFGADLYFGTLQESLMKVLQEDIGPVELLEAEHRGQLKIRLPDVANGQFDRLSRWMDGKAIRLCSCEACVRKLLQER